MVMPMSNEKHQEKMMMNISYSSNTKTSQRKRRRRMVVLRLRSSYALSIPKKAAVLLAICSLSSLLVNQKQQQNEGVFFFFVSSMMLRQHPPLSRRVAKYYPQYKYYTPIDPSLSLSSKRRGSSSLLLAKSPARQYLDNLNNNNASSDNNEREGSTGEMRMNVNGAAPSAGAGANGDDSISIISTDLQSGGTNIKRGVEGNEEEQMQEKAAHFVQDEEEDWGIDGYEDSILPVVPATENNETGGDTREKSNGITTTISISESPNAWSGIEPEGDDEFVHPNEEPPLPTTEGTDEDQLVMNLGEALSPKSSDRISKFETIEDMAATTTAIATEEDKAAVDTTEQTGIKAMLQNFLGGNEEAKSRAESEERRRKWSTWMTTGRKVRDTDKSPSSSEAGGDITTGSKDGVGSGALDETLLSVDKGADYVVVAVPAEAADGVGPILSSFPGGKLFQKTVGKTFQDVIINAGGDGNNMGGGGSGTTTTTASGGTNSTTSTTTSSSSSSSSSTKSPTVEIKRKKKKKEKKEKQQRSKNKTKKDEEKDIELDTKRRRERDYQQRQRQQNQQQAEREPGRISSKDWRHNMQNIGSSTILRDVRNPMAWTFLWGTMWSVLHKWLTRFVATAASTTTTAAAVTTTTTAAAAAAEGVVVMGSGMTSLAVSSRWVKTAAWFLRHMCLPAVQHTMMVSAMSLLLVFRTNSAYQRFAEGRKIWNDIVDTSRDFSRMLKLYEFAIGKSKCRRIYGLLASYPYLLRHRIRPSLMTFYRVNDLNVERDPEHSLLLYPDESLRDTDLESAALAYNQEEMGSSRRKTRELCWVDKRTLPWKLMTGSELELCSRAQNRPLWVCDRMAKELAVVNDLTPTDLTPTFTNRERLALIGYVDKLSRSIGACERIHQTVVPLNYARHALRSLTVWLWTLPFVLVKDLGLLTGPVLAVLSWILFGVYEIGSRIEDPFQGTLRLSIYCDAIRRDVLADAIARDTAFILEEDSPPSADKDGGSEAIFELDSESEEYDEDDVPTTKKKDKKKKTDFLGSLLSELK